MISQIEQIKWHARFIIREYEGDINAYRESMGANAGEAAFYASRSPIAERVIKGNLLLNEGKNTLFKLLVGDAATTYSNANARLGVGNGTAAAVSTQTGLQGASSLYKAMDVGYPVVSAEVDGKVTFRSSFGDAEANFAWEEVSVDNGAAAGKNLNRKVQALGTKSSGTWQLTLEISLS